MIINISGDTLVSIPNLTDVATGDFVNDATVVGTLLDSANNLITTFAMDYVADSDGNYQGIIPASVSEDLTPCTKYVVQIQITGSYTGLIVKNATADYQRGV